MFQDVSKCFGIGNLGHYEMTRATKMTPVNLSYELQMFGNPFHREPEAESGLVSGCFRMFQDGSKCFGIGNLGHYEMTRATKMTPVNL